jgi:glycosyltransferase involved in cell wall biosynthesis
MVTISYAITAVNEHIELERLLDQLNNNIRPEDEIVVQLDNTATPEVKKIAEKYNVGTPYEYHRIIFALNKDFATFKNNLKNHCTRDFIFFIDADEYLGEELINNLPEILELNPTHDIFLIPRVNTVEGITHEHIVKWGWDVNDRGWINYPDYQTRLCKNRKDIQWFGKVHERLQSNESLLGEVFPTYYGLDLIHPKTIDRQEKQNNFYNTI